MFFTIPIIHPVDTGNLGVPSNCPRNPSPCSPSPTPNSMQHSKFVFWMDRRHYHNAKPVMSNDDISGQFKTFTLVHDVRDDSFWSVNRTKKQWTKLASWCGNKEFTTKYHFANGIIGGHPDLKLKLIAQLTFNKILLMRINRDSR